MKKELEYFNIGKAYGGSQYWFSDFMMKLGGCAAVTACDCCIYFSLYRGMDGICPFPAGRVTRKKYIDFSKIMKPYLRPRMSGIDTLEIYMDGFSSYLNDQGEKRLSMKPLPGSAEVYRAVEAVRSQIDGGFPVPCLILEHQDPGLKDYVWHWFLLTGYDEEGENMRVKAVSYGKYIWLDLERLWNTGREKKGGLVLFDINE